MFESARLTDAHTLEGFDCGKESLNTWLIAHARRADSSGVAHVYVWTPLGEQKVSAYFAICPAEVVRNDDGVSGSMAGGYSRIPGYLIARLAIDTSLRAFMGLRPGVGNENHGLVRLGGWLHSPWPGLTLKRCFGDPVPPCCW